MCVVSPLLHGGPARGAAFRQMNGGPEDRPFSADGALKVKIHDYTCIVKRYTALVYKY